MKECFGKSIVACILSVCAFGQLTGCEDYPAGYGLRTTCENGICEPQTCSESQECGGDLECRGGICRAHVELGVSLNGKPEVHESSDSTVTLEVTLPTKPTAPVIVYITVSDDSEIGVSVVEITIDPEDWDKPHPVTISGVSDGIVDGDQTSTVTITTASEDPNYDGLVDDSIRITTVDDGTCEGENCPEVCEGENCPEVCEGENCPEVCEGENCPEVCQGDNCPITCEEGKTPSGCPDEMVCKGGICTQPAGLNISLNGTPEVHESSDSTVSFDISLPSKPTAPVTVQITVSDDSEIGVSVTEITIDPEDWDKPHPVTISGVADGIVDGDQISGITITTESEDPDYNGLKDDTIQITTIDDDTCEGDDCPITCEEGKTPSDCPAEMVCKGGICKQPAGINIALNGTPEVHESADSTASFDITLPTKPTAPVTVQITVSDDSEIGVSVTEITIDPEDWDKPHTITVSGVSDDIVDGPQISGITLTTVSEDPEYNGLQNDTVRITTVDDNTAELKIDSTAETLSESGGTTTFTFQLTSRPQEPVTVVLSSSDPTALTVTEPTTVTIDPDDWDKPITVTIAAMDDPIADGTQSAQINLTTTSEDPNYNGLTGVTAVYSILDDEQPGIVLSATTTELLPGSYSTTVTAVLSYEPTEPVTVTLTTSDANLAKPETVTLVFTPENWNTEQVVTVTAVDVSAMEQAAATASIQGTGTSDCEGYNGLKSNELEFNIYAYDKKEYGYPPDVSPDEKACVVEYDTLLPGSYKFEVWGASGGDQVGLNQESGSHAGLGGYAEGILTLTEKADIVIHVGSMGTAGTLDYGENAKGGGCNGGGGGTQSKSTGAHGYGGGGGSDIRIGGDTYYHRVIVAGGGGGSDDGTEETADVVGGWNDGSGGYGGGEMSGQGYKEGKPYYAASTDKTGYRFGDGESAGTKAATSDTGGGGGGWFGGYAGAEHNSGGSGGSGYVYTSTAAVVEGYLVDSKYQLTEAKTVAGNQSFPSASGGEEVGHKGDGFVRISLIK